MAIARHGQPYATLHRADLHALLLAAVQEHGLTELRLNTRLASFTESPEGVVTTLDDGSTLAGTALLGCDGLWSRVRARLLGPQPVRASGHLAFTFKPGADPTTTVLTVTYDVGGYAKGGLAEQWAKPVDGVIGEQVGRLKKQIETGRPD